MVRTVVVYGVAAQVAQLTGRISKITAAAKGLPQSYEETEG